MTAEALKETALAQVKEETADAEKYRRLAQESEAYDKGIAQIFRDAAKDEEVHAKHMALIAKMLEAEVERWKQ